MSLNNEQRDGTRQELRRNLELSGLSSGELVDALGFTEERLEATLRIDADSDPADVWVLRDFLESTVRARGVTPERYRVLTDDADGRAERWFGLRRPPTRRAP